MAIKRLRAANTERTRFFITSLKLPIITVVVFDEHAVSLLITMKARCRNSRCRRASSVKLMDANEQQPAQSNYRQKIEPDRNTEFP